MAPGTACPPRFLLTARTSHKKGWSVTFQWLAVLRGEPEQGMCEVDLTFRQNRTEAAVNHVQAAHGPGEEEADLGQGAGRGGECGRPEN